ncbi:MAG: complex I NDUFA9 subunit family protein [Xanthomonadales bacterium]|jgi:NADH dehydrogenase|nr:complex I NDUFA9 subunit family protein [Xanthomonadales bacterium]
MRIVLVGASGFLGHHVLPQLSAAGHDCLVLSRYRPGCRDLTVLPGVTVRQLRNWSPDSIARQLSGANAVISMAGILNEKGRKGDGFRKVHVELVENIVAACRETGTRRFLHISALGAGKGTSHYLQSKGAAETFLRSSTDIDETIIQPSVIFGQGDAFFNRFASLLKVMPFMPLACADARMQPVWAGDVAAVIVASLADPATVGQTLVTVGPHEYSLQELVEFTADVAGLKRRVVALPDWLARIQAGVMDFVPGKPFSSDNYRSLQTPNTSEENCLWRFGIQPRSIESVVPDYLGHGKHQKRLDQCRRWVNR